MINFKLLNQLLKQKQVKVLRCGESKSYVDYVPSSLLVYFDSVQVYGDYVLISFMEKTKSSIYKAKFPTKDLKNALDVLNWDGCKYNQLLEDYLGDADGTCCLYHMNKRIRESRLISQKKTSDNVYSVMYVNCRFVGTCNSVAELLRECFVNTRNLEGKAENALKHISLQETQNEKKKDSRKDDQKAVAAAVIRHQNVR